MTDPAHPSLDELGWAQFRDQPALLQSGLGISRVAIEHRGAYELIGPHGDLEAAVDASIRDGAVDDRDFPAVGDWVVHSLDERHDRRVLIQEILPRTSAVVRRAPGHEPVPQVVAANVDVICVVTTPTEDLNERRLERYLVTAFGSGAMPVIVVNKIDLAEDGLDRSRLGVLADGVDLFEASATMGHGMAALAELGAGGRTLAFIGSSGVGKSSLVNRLLGDELLETGAVRSDGRGRHTTVRRQLLPMEGGGTLIDTPGLREVQLWDDGGLDAAFPRVIAAAADCRFSDCGHQGEPGCAVRAAIDAGEVDARRLEAYLDLAVELAALDDEREEHERVQRRRRDARSQQGRGAWRDDVDDE